MAALLGGVIGVERELRERYVGLRTHLLVSVAVALFAVVSVYAWAVKQVVRERGDATA